jgi:hypothetical protein
MSSWQNIGNNNYTNPQSGRFNYLKANEINADVIRMEDLIINDDLIVNGDISCNQDILLNDGRNLYIGGYRVNNAVSNSLPGLRLHYNSTYNYASVLDFSGTYFAIRKNLDGSDVEKFYVDADNGYTDVSFGVGTTTPAYKLDVSGVINSNSAIMMTNENSLVNDRLQIADNFDVSGTLGKGYLYYNTNGELGRFQKNGPSGATRWTITPAGIFTNFNCVNYRRSNNTTFNFDGYPGLQYLYCYGGQCGNINLPVTSRIDGMFIQIGNLTSQSLTITTNGSGYLATSINNNTTTSVILNAGSVATFIWNSEDDCWFGWRVGGCTAF